MPLILSPLLSKTLLTMLLPSKFLRLSLWSCPVRPMAGDVILLLTDMVTSCRPLGPTHDSLMEGTKFTSPVLIPLRSLGIRRPSWIQWSIPPQPTLRLPFITLIESPFRVLVLPLPPGWVFRCPTVLSLKLRSPVSLSGSGLFCRPPSPCTLWIVLRLATLWIT